MIVVAHISGEVGAFYTVLLSVYSSTCLPIFIDVGLYLRDTWHKIGWHSFLRHSVVFNSSYVYSLFNYAYQKIIILKILFWY